MHPHNGIIYPTLTPRVLLDDLSFLQSAVSSPGHREIDWLEIRDGKNSNFLIVQDGQKLFIKLPLRGEISDIA